MFSEEINDRSVSAIRDAAERGELIIVAGTGLSMALTNGEFQQLSWKGLVNNGFDYGVRKGIISEIQKKNWAAQLLSDDIDDLLGAAEFVGRKLGAPNGDMYARWFADVFSVTTVINKRLANNIKRYIEEIPFCTLNYDTLLEQLSDRDTVNFNETKRAAEWFRRSRSGILHLHGVWNDPGSCVLGIRDYDRSVGDEVRDLFQRSLAVSKTILFIGCGDTFADPNFSNLILWLRMNVGVASPSHYALVLESEWEKRNADAQWHGFVEPVSYGQQHSDLSPFLTKLIPKNKSKSTQSRNKLNRDLEIKYERVLADYQEFLLSDCGQMTIEGVRADMDTAQRKFDLEKLFVPLDVEKLPPEIPDSDPQKNEKIAEWKERNKTPRSFGEVLNEDKRIALLALPGGGKTLLLKRLVVAYADKSRLTMSRDALPDLDVFPMLLRCREWRTHITKPIESILAQMSEITGNSSLGKLFEAVKPSLVSGKVMLLVDGMDEIQNDADREILAENLENFVSKYPKIRLVLTSREAGFRLIAPTIFRFCSSWRISHLSEESIRLLAMHWHKLMGANGTDYEGEAKEVSRKILNNNSLHRLAENPLLLTMLLVVKHGAGKMPPDRASLYDRAVEVLLDTWNIKGHEALNVKEAVPQLAFIALALTERGEQTATQKQLLELIELARDTVPQIKRYARDTPLEFLKRVELRSSLLVEAGFKLESGKTVAFYQFRHLTFQEYLTAVAVVEGHYSEYSDGHTVLSKLETHLESEEWKEIIPMTAVLARKQAEPLISFLTDAADREFNSDHDHKLNFGSMPLTVQHLLRSLAEEAEASQALIDKALGTLVYYGYSMLADSQAKYWFQLFKGPYGNDFLVQAKNAYENEIGLTYTIELLEEFWIRSTYGASAIIDLESKSKSSRESAEIIIDKLQSSDEAHQTEGLILVHGIEINNRLFRDQNQLDIPIPVSLIESLICSENFQIRALAISVWSGMDSYSMSRPSPNIKLLDPMLELFFHSKFSIDIVAQGLVLIEPPARYSWTPNLSKEQVTTVSQLIRESREDRPFGFRSTVILLYLGFHIPGIITDAELITWAEAAIKNSKLYVSSEFEELYKKIKPELTE